jgi:hypothetical protein
VSKSWSIFVGRTTDPDFQEIGGVGDRIDQVDFSQEISVPAITDEGEIVGFTIVGPGHRALAILVDLTGSQISVGFEEDGYPRQTFDLDLSPDDLVASR